MNKSITSDALKWIAVITMLIDHIGAGIIEKTNLFLLPYGKMSDVILRGIGRLAFPIFCFLLIEGFYHTRNRQKYLFQLYLFAILSEIPFEILFVGKIVMGFRNVYWTLAIGMTMLLVLDKLGMYFSERKETEKGKLAALLVAAVFAIMAECLHTDYGAIGIFLIFILYQTHRDRKRQCILGAVAMSYEITTPVAFLLIYRYNGIRKQKRMKYFFYCFYPLHILLLYWVRTLIL